jgi:salicylate hydroxylase
MTDQVIIIGDGAAGLSMALAMAKAKKHVTLIGANKAPADRVLGGVQMAANGWSALQELGCDAAVWEHAKRLELMRIMSLANGHSLVSIPLDEQHRRQPYASVTRHGLITSLAAVVAAAPCITHITATATHIESHADHAVVIDSDQRSYKADWIFGADGMMGLCRQYVDGGDKITPNKVTPNKVTPRRTSRYATRFHVPLDTLPPVLASASTSVWLGRMGHMVHYPLADGHLNLVVMTHDSNDRDDENRQTQRWASVMSLIAAHPWLESADENLARENAYMMPLQSWPRCDSWIRGRVVVTGDSAHQMPPHLAQGTGQALIDAASLSRMLSGGMAMTDAIPAWAGMRMRRIRSVLASADQAGNLFALPPILSPVRDIMVGLGGMAIMPRILDKIWSDQL